MEEGRRGRESGKEWKNKEDVKIEKNKAYERMGRERK